MDLDTLLIHIKVPKDTETDSLCFHCLFHWLLHWLRFSISNVLMMFLLRWTLTDKSCGSHEIIRINTQVHKERELLTTESFSKTYALKPTCKPYKSNTFWMHILIPVFVYLCISHSLRQQRVVVSQGAWPPAVRSVSSNRLRPEACRHSGKLTFPVWETRKEATNQQPV